MVTLQTLPLPTPWNSAYEGKKISLSLNVVKTLDTAAITVGDSYKEVSSPGGAEVNQPITEEMRKGCVEEEE